MLSSPAKRRKTSETTAAAIDASKSNKQAHESNNRVRQRRPSFQSPTKASLARSHPDILTRAISRSPARHASKASKNGQDEEFMDSRTFGLRDRKALRPSLTADASPVDGRKLSPRRRSSGVAAFAAPPRRVSRRIAPSDLVFGTPDAKPQNATNRPPEDTPGDQLASELDSATMDIDANNVDADPLPLDEGLQEPELPPTPTQLGLEKPPGRPTGLSSSSPTAQYEKRARRRINETPKPSPLKLKSFKVDVESGDLSGAGLAIDQGPVPEPVPRKRKARKELSAELQQLQDDIAELENWTEKLNKPDGRPDLAGGDLSKLLSLLSSEVASHKQSASSPTKPPISSILSALLPFSTKAPPKPQQEPPSPTNPFALKQHAQTKQHLTVFAPLTLTTHSSKVSASKQDSLTETHKLTLSAGSPFPPKLYNVTVIYETNPETQSLTSISFSDSSEGNESSIPDGLRRWINSRLSNPLLKLDVSGLCWGINRYWEATISRARIWSRVENRHSRLLANRNRRGPDHQNQGEETSSNTGNLSTPDLRHLIPHLDRTTMIFGPKGETLQVLLSCTLTIDEWTSEPRLLPEISISAPSKSRGGSGRKVEQEAKKLFYTLLKGEQSGPADSAGDIDTDAVVRAAEGVLGVLFGLDTIDQQQYPKGKLAMR